MRKVIGYPKAWPRIRNASAAKCNFRSSGAALEPAQGLESISHQRCSDTQSSQMGFLGKLGNGIGSEQSRAKCTSVVQFSVATSRSLQSLLPSSVAVLRWVPSTPGTVEHTGPASDLRVSRNSSLAVISGLSDGDEHGDRRDGHGDRRDGDVEGCTSVKPSWSYGDRAVLFDSEKDNVKFSQTKPRNEGRAQNTETARQWSLYLNGQQRRFRPHSSGLKLFNSTVNSPSVFTRCKSPVPGVATKLIYSEQSMNDLTLKIRMLFVTVWTYDEVNVALTLCVSWSSEN
jgi:hypothetical protein